MPWRAEEDARGEHATWRAAYTAHGIVPRRGDPVRPPDEDDELEEIEDAGNNEADAEWMVIARQHPNQDVQRVEIGRREMDLAHQWTEAPLADIGQLVNAVDVSRAHHQFAASVAEAPNVQLTAEQSVVMSILERQIAAAQGGGGPAPPQRVIVQGCAGCGKSTVISAMTSRIVAAFGAGSFLLLAPTGAAAVNIGGQTIHSGLLISPASADYAPLTGNSAKDFQDSMEPVKFIIVDEYSMIGLILLAMMELRCCEAKPRCREPFGGMYVYLIGDLAQLPPVLQQPIFSNKGSSNLHQRGRSAFQNFQHAVVLTVSQRQADPTFRAALDELALGKCSNESYELFRRRFVHRLPPAEQRVFHDAVHIFTTNEGARGFNLQRLENLRLPVARIPARHNNTIAEHASANKGAGGLERVLYLSVGARVMLRANLWTAAGLVNGATGTVTDIVYPVGSGPPDNPPAVVMVKFDKYTGPDLSPDGSVPIGSIIRSWKEDFTSCTREQIPLTLAWACTVHGAQGLSCDYVAANIGNAEFSAGLAYVALSRCRTWEGLLIEQPFLQRRLDRLQNMPSLQKKVAAIARIERMARRTALVMHNLFYDIDRVVPPMSPSPPPPASGRRRPASSPPPGGRSKRGRGNAPPPRGGPSGRGSGARGRGRGRPAVPPPPPRGGPSGRGSGPRGRGRPVPPPPPPPRGGPSGRGSGAPGRGRPPRQPRREFNVQVHGGVVTAARINGDGHCLFVSLLHQLNNSLPSPDQVTELRQRVVQHIRAQLVGPEAALWTELLVTTVNGQAHRYPPTDDDAVRIHNFLEALLDGEWGAAETIVAVAQLERVNVTMYTEGGYAPQVFSPPGGGTRDIAVVYRLRLAAAEEEDPAQMWNHYDSVVEFLPR